MSPDLARGGACNDGNFGGGCRPDRKWVFTPMRNHGLPDGPYRRLPHISDRGRVAIARPARRQSDRSAWETQSQFKTRFTMPTLFASIYQQQPIRHAAEANAIRSAAE